MKCLKYFATISLLLIKSHCIGQINEKLYDQEKEYIQVFNNFKSYIINSIDKNIDISDSVQIKYILLNYIITESPIDITDKNHFKQNEIPIEKYNKLVYEIRGFRQYFLEKKSRNLIQHISVLPIRLSSDKCIYDKLIPFQQQNTLAYYDDRNPSKILGYILFMPRIKDVLSISRIWSWTLQFEAGNWAFRSPMGTVGIEYFISDGVKGPEHPIDY